MGHMSIFIFWLMGVGDVVISFSTLNSSSIQLLTEHELPWFACQLMHPPRIRRLQALICNENPVLVPSLVAATPSAPPFPDLIFLINLN
jgi:hypothetical protein